MKVIRYSEANPKLFDDGNAKGVAGRVVIGKADGAPSFCMRVFEVAAGGQTPRHSHAWEHEMFFHAGEGEVLSDGNWTRVAPGTAVFVPGGAEHQVRNAGGVPLVFVCLVPSSAPEI